MASVSATINTLPVLCTEKDCKQPRQVAEEEESLSVMFQSNECEQCCGIVHLGHADGESERGTHESGDNGGFPTRFKEAMVEALNDQASEWSGKGLLTYSVNDSQGTEHEALKEAGFLPMAIFRNPNSGNRVTLYGKAINQPRAKPVVAKKKSKK